MSAQLNGEILETVSDGAVAPAHVVEQRLTRMVVRRRLQQIAAQIDGRLEAIETADSAAQVAEATREIAERLDRINEAAFYLPGTSMARPVTVIELVTVHRTTSTAPAPNATALEA